MILVLRQMSQRFRLAVILVVGLASFGGLAHAQSDDASQGLNAYRSNCSSCHGEAGEGVPGVFPPLVEHIAGVTELESGTDYLLHVLLFGLEGPILVNGEQYNGVMPGWGHLPDSTLISLMNFVLAEWGTPESEVTVDLDDISRARDSELAPEDVYNYRSEIGLAMPGGSDVQMAIESFTSSQASSGQSLYRNNCASCHGDDLRGNIDGPELVGDYFLSYWGDRSAAELYGYAKANMPPGRPGSLEDQQYLDIITWILTNNGHIAEGSQPWRPENHALQQIKNNAGQNN